jgi:protein-tyrosine phosphatase
MFSSVCVVCTGNICRSPMGEALLRERAGDRLKEVYSAGIGALVNHPADAHAIDVMAEHGIDISAHRAQQATQAVMTRADLVLTLDATHSRWLKRQYPELRGRVFKLLHWRDDADVPDPYRLPRSAFVQSYDLIVDGVEDWVKRLG